MSAPRACGGWAFDDASRDDFPAAADRPRCTAKGDSMTWQTPTAVDMRFGFEITMYIAAR